MLADAGAFRAIGLLLCARLIPVFTDTSAIVGGGVAARMSSFTKGAPGAPLCESGLVKVSFQAQAAGRMHRPAAAIADTPL